jgi:hypothetical protein
MDGLLSMKQRDPESDRRTGNGDKSPSRAEPSVGCQAISTPRRRLRRACVGATADARAPRRRIEPACKNPAKDGNEIADDAIRRDRHIQWIRAGYVFRARSVLGHNLDCGHPRAAVTILGRSRAAGHRRRHDGQCSSHRTSDLNATHHIYPMIAFLILTSHRES